MTAKYFSDTNIVLYTMVQDSRKAGIARGIVAVRPMVSAQVVNEAINVCLRKLGFDREKAYAFADSIMRRAEVLPIDEATIRKSAELAIRYQLSKLGCAHCGCGHAGGVLYPLFRGYAEWSGV